MKFAYTVLFILVTQFLVSGCSEDKSANYENKNVDKKVAKNVVRKAIQKPVKTTEPQKEPQKEVTETLKTDPGKVTKQETVKEKVLPVHEDKKEEVKPVQETKKEDLIQAQKENIYITKEGDTLSGISGRSDIYDTPLKWPLLYRDNPDVLSKIKDKKNIYEASLPAGLKLKIISTEEVEKNLEDRSGYYYVANLISSPSMKEIAPQVVKLIDAGYFVYITSAVVDDREWYRVRAGFYQSRTDANNEGDKIGEQLHIPDIWTVKIGDIEFHTYAGY